MIWKTGNQIGKWSLMPQNVTSYESQKNNKAPYVYDYQLKGQALVSLHSVKYFREYLSDDLLGNEHVNNISNKANKSFGFLKRNLRYYPRKTKEMACKALVRPTLEYCSTVWDPYTA